MQIKTGYLKNKNVEVPETAKPVKSVVLNSIYSTIGDLVKDSICLDLFAGSGILGFEALSRGAKSCVFIENSYIGAKTIENTAKNLNLESKSEVINIDALKYLGSATDNFDLVFLDPPYEMPTKHLFKILNYVVNRNSLVVYLKDKNTTKEYEHGYKVLKEKTFGKTAIIYLKLKP